VIYTGDASATAPTLLAVIIAGIARSGMQQYDETAVFLDVAALRSRLRFSDAEGSYVAVYPGPEADIADVAQRIRSTFTRTSGLYVQTYHDRFSAIESWIALQQEPIPIILGLISLVAIATVVATLLISVVEKTRQIAVLRTMGMTSGGIARIFLWRGLQVGFVGWFAGSALALLCCLIQDTWHVISLDGNLYYVSSLPVSITATPYVIVAITSLATSLIATLAPIVIASGIQPARTLQFR
jgi:lipoprotein-releasing system permease protein